MGSGLWVKLDASYYLDVAILDAGEAAEVLFVRSLGLAKAALTDGLLTRRQLLTLGLKGLDTRIAALVTVGLWLPVDRGWQIRSWLRWNQSAERVAEIRELRRAAGRLRQSRKQSAEQSAQHFAEQSAEQSAKQSAEQDAETTTNPEAEAEAEAEAENSSTPKDFAVHALSQVSEVAQQPAPSDPPATPQRQDPRPRQQPQQQRQKREQPPLPPECQQILDANWLAHAPLPASSCTPSGIRKCLDTIRLLHEADHQPWPEVARITEHGATVWQPAGWMLSPAKLRSPTSSGECKVWEKIRAQMDNPGKRNGQSSAADNDAGAVLDEINRRYLEGA